MRRSDCLNTVVITFYITFNEATMPAIQGILDLAPVPPFNPESTLSSNLDVYEGNGLVEQIVTPPPFATVKEDNMTAILGTISKMDQHSYEEMLWNIVKSRGGSQGDRISTAWNVVLIQLFLVSVIIVMSLLWALCCKKRCFTRDQDESNGISGPVANLMRKISSGSRDLPPSYSRVDLTSVGLTLNDHLNPPPTYDNVGSEVFFINCRPQRSSATSSTASPPSYRSRSASRSSRVTFAENLTEDLMAGPRRQLSVLSLPINPTPILVHGRKRSVQSEAGEGSPSFPSIQPRRQSLIEQVTNLIRSPTGRGDEERALYNQRSNEHV